MGGTSTDTRRRQLEEQTEPNRPVEMRMNPMSEEKRSVAHRVSENKQPNRSIPQKQNQASSLNTKLPERSQLTLEKASRPNPVAANKPQPRKQMSATAAERATTPRTPVQEPPIHGSRFASLDPETSGEPRTPRQAKRRSSGEHEHPGHQRKHSSVSPVRNSQRQHDKPPSAYNNPKTGLGRSASTSDRRSSGSIDMGYPRNRKAPEPAREPERELEPRTVRLQKKITPKAQAMVDRLSAPRTRHVERTPQSPRERPDTSMSERSARSARSERVSERSVEHERQPERSSQRGGERNGERPPQRSVQNPSGRQGPTVNPRGSSKQQRLNEHPASPPQTPKNQQQRGAPLPNGIPYDVSPPYDPRQDPRQMGSHGQGQQRSQRRSDVIEQSNSSSWLGSMPIVGQMFRYSDNSPPKEYYQQIERENAWLKQQIEQLKRQRDEMNNSLSGLNNINDQLQADLLEIQKKSFKEMSKANWVPLEDRAILEVFDEIHKDIEDWADDNCKEDLMEIGEGLTGEQKVELMAFMGQVAEINCQDLDEQLKYWVDTGLDPVLLLTALATHHMYLSVFRNPFGVLDALAPGGNVGVTMMGIYQNLRQLDIKQAHQWRSNLFRILFHQPSSGGKFDGLRPRSESLETELPIFTHTRCSTLVELFESSPILHLLRPSRDPSTRSNLIDCFVRTMDIFTQLQTQVASIDWSDPETSRLVEKPFDPRHMIPHRSQAFPEGRNEGKTTSLVVSPLVAFFGTEDGVGYKRWRAVAKAVALVLVEEPKEDLPQPLEPERGMKQQRQEQEQEHGLEDEEEEEEEEDTEEEEEEEEEGDGEQVEGGEEETIEDTEPKEDEDGDLILV
ncbi:hypothetical protein B0J14DRAFT_567311 [Halenospora varia]|nr:hypothetical protein B0J14DRAFT_567311 [Halenospora varia]